MARARYVPPSLRHDRNVEGSNDTTGTEESSPPATTGEAPRSLSALASTADNSISNTTGPIRYTTDEVHEHFCPAAAVVNLNNGFQPCLPSSLNNSFEHPDELAYVMLFPDANPKWESHNIMYAKSNMELLPGLEGLVLRGWTDGGGLKKFLGGKPLDRGKHWRGRSAKAAAEQASAGAEAAEQPKPSGSEDDNKPSTTQDSQQTKDAESTYEPAKSVKPLVDYEEDDDDLPTPPASTQENQSDVVSTRLIPVFQQMNRGYRTVEFIGYYQMQRISYLRPRSPALLHMLELKFGQEVPESPSRTKQSDDQDKADEAGQSAAGVTESPERQETQNASSTTTTQTPKSKPKSGNRHPRLGEGLAERTREAWERSLSVPWAVLRMKLVARPDAAGEIPQDNIDFWDQDKGVKPPGISTHPEDDEEHYKKSRDEYKARRAWRIEHGLEAPPAPQIQRHPEKDAEQQRASNFGRGGNRGGSRGWGRGWGRGGANRGGRGDWSGRGRGRGDNGNRGRGFGRGRGGGESGLAQIDVPSEGWSEVTLFQTGTEGEFNTDSQAASGGWDAEFTDRTKKTGEEGQANGGAEVGNWNEGW